MWWQIQRRSRNTKLQPTAPHHADWAFDNITVSHGALTAQEFDWTDELFTRLPRNAVTRCVAVMDRSPAQRLMMYNAQVRPRIIRITRRSPRHQPRHPTQPRTQSINLGILGLFSTPVFVCGISVCDLDCFLRCFKNEIDCSSVMWLYYGDCLLTLSHPSM